MKLYTKEKFLAEVRKIKDRSTQKQIQQFLQMASICETREELLQKSRVAEWGINYTRIGHYRILFAFTDDSIVLVDFIHK